MSPPVDRRDEQGSITPFVVLIVLAMLIVVGLVVDGGGKIRAMQRADAVAGQAGRAAGEEIQGGPAVRGEISQVDAAAARRAAQQYLRASGVRGTVRVVNGTRVRVEASVTYKPVFAQVLGLGPQRVTGDSEVELVQGIDRPIGGNQ